MPAGNAAALTRSSLTANFIFTLTKRHNFGERTSLPSPLFSGALDFQCVIISWVYIFVFGAWVQGPI
jgi:hypothetical protein